MPLRCQNPNAPTPDDHGWLHYVEPYAGSLSVLLANDPEGISEVINDKNSDLTNFWSILQGQTSFNQFQRLVQAIPFSEVQYTEAQLNIIFKVDGYEHSIRLAATFFAYCRQSLAGRMNGFAAITKNRTRRGMNEQVSAWLNAVEGLPAVHERLKRVLILNRDALDVIRQQDGPHTLFYLDPPYLHETRATHGEYGEHEMLPGDHAALLDVLALLKGKFLLSGYRSELYDRLAQVNNWNRHEFKIDNKAASGKIKREMTECVWTNYQ